MTTISVAIPTFNCARLLGETLRSVLEEDLPPERLDIAVVDDCSTMDDPEAVVKQLGYGRVRFLRHERNVGIARNFNACVRQAKGDLIHILHGDDFVLPGFHRAVLDAADRFPDAGLIGTRAFVVDEAGEIDTLTGRLPSFESPSRDFRPLINRGNPLVTPSVVVRRSAYARVGLFEESLSHVGAGHRGVRRPLHQPASRGLPRLRRAGHRQGEADRRQSSRVSPAGRPLDARAAGIRPLELPPPRRIDGGAPSRRVRGEGDGPSFGSEPGRAGRSPQPTVGHFHESVSRQIGMKSMHLLEFSPVHGGTAA
jgi:hypothetical protein